MSLLLAAYEDDGLLLRIEYDTTHFDATTIERLGDQLATLLEHIAEAPVAAPLHSVTMLSAAEHDELVDGLNPAPGRPVPSLLDRFEQRARTTPDRIALSAADSDEALTYATLERRANQFAHLLAARGVGSGDLVAICLDRSTGFIVAMLGVLKAGAAYVPDRPVVPRRRHRPHAHRRSAACRDHRRRADRTARRRRLPGRGDHRGCRLLQRRATTTGTP